jgi:hypothetical protein
MTTQKIAKISWHYVKNLQSFHAAIFTGEFALKGESGGAARPRWRMTFNRRNFFSEPPVVTSCS